MPLIKKLEMYSYDANPDATVKISSLLKYFQQIAREDLQSYGISYNMMRDANQIFVIIKSKICFNRKINIYENLSYKTVPTKVVGITFFRDFFIIDDKDSVIAECSTSWILINFETRRILRPSELVHDIPSFPDEASDIQLSRKFDFDECPVFSKTNVRKVYLSNLDENNHLNNAETAAFALDEISDVIMNGREILSFEIHFNHESHLNDIIEIKTDFRESSCFVSALNKNHDENAFDCLVTLKL